ncbi:MAG: M23 family metallopeptidase [Candidatus Hydrogenedentota bacterium]|nr:MAG: M23 family metallopeptidase [Candidatus Hydrogenedentota bacterium]
MNQNTLLKQAFFLAGVAAVLLSFSRGASSFAKREEPAPLEPALALTGMDLDYPAGDGLEINALKKVEFHLIEGRESEEPEEDWGGGYAEKTPVQKAKKTKSSSAHQPTSRRVRMVIHKVKRGESLGRIARKYGVDVATIMNVNGLRSTVLRPGKRLKVPNRKGIRIRLRRGENLWTLARYYHVKIGDVVEANGLKDAGNVRAGQYLFLPGAKARSGHGREGSVKYYWPIRGGRLSSRFGYRRHPITHKVRFHAGIDIAAPKGTVVHAVRGGRVIRAGYVRGYGYLVDIHHADGTITRYAHNSKILVKRGQRVAGGQPIARVGSTGLSTGPHLHLEVIRGGRRLNPLKAWNGALRRG